MQGQEMNISTELKYREAITLYSDSVLSIKDICERTGVGFSAFSSYLSKHHRELILKRHNLTEHENVKLRGSKGQTTSAHYKYLTINTRMPLPRSVSIRRCLECT